MSISSCVGQEKNPIRKRTKNVIWSDGFPASYPCHVAFCCSSYDGNDCQMKYMSYLTMKCMDWMTWSYHYHYFLCNFVKQEEKKSNMYCNSPRLFDQLDT